MPDDNSLLSVLWMLGCILLVLAAAWFFTRYVVGSGRLGFGALPKTGQARVLMRLPLTRESQLLLVQIGSRCFLLGVASAGVSLLAEFTLEEVEAFLPDKKAAGSTEQENFGEVIQNMLKRKDKR